MVWGPPTDLTIISDVKMLAILEAIMLELWLPVLFLNFQQPCKVSAWYKKLDFNILCSKILRKKSKQKMSKF